MNTQAKLNEQGKIAKQKIIVTNDKLIHYYR